MATYGSTADFLKAQIRNFKEALNPDRVLRPAVISSIAPIKNRIQQRGQKSDGSQIGKYSDGKLSFSKITERFGDIANQKQLKARQKKFTGKSEFSGGYKEFRQDLGRQVAYVDLTLTGEMMRAFTAFPIKDGYAMGFNNSEQATIGGYNEKKYGDVFPQTEQERNATLNEINRVALAILSR